MAETLQEKYLREEQELRKSQRRTLMAVGTGLGVLLISIFAYMGYTLHQHSMLLDKIMAR